MTQILGVLAEFETEEAVIAAARRVRDAGYRRWDCHTPYPVHGLDGAMGMGSTALPWMVLGGGTTGFLFAVWLQWWTNAIDYPFVISGKPMWSIPANIPVIFELTILFSAFAAFFGMLVMNGLPKLYNPVFRSDRFRRATQDRFFIFIEGSDGHFNASRTPEFLAVGASHVELISKDDPEADGES